MSDRPTRVKIICTACGREYGVPEQHLGQTVRCRCGEDLDLLEPKVQVSCTHCKRAYRVRSRHVGKTVECRCGESISLTASALADRVLVHRLETWSFLRMAFILATVGMAVGCLLGLALRAAGVVPTYDQAPSGRPMLWVLRIGAHVVAVFLAQLIFLSLFNWVMRRTGGWLIRLGQTREWQDGTRTLTRVDMVSALWVCAITGAVWGVVWAVTVVCFSAHLAKLGIEVSPLGQLAGSLLCAVGGTLVSVIVYNWVAGRFGGIRFESSVPVHTAAEPLAETAESPIPIRAVGVLEYAQVGLAWGVFGSILSLLPVSAIAVLAMTADNGSVVLLYALAWLLGIPILDFVIYALSALLYNLAGWITGGLRVEVS